MSIYTTTALHQITTIIIIRLIIIIIIIRLQFPLLSLLFLFPSKIYQTTNKGTRCGNSNSAKTTSNRALRSRSTRWCSSPRSCVGLLSAKSTLSSLFNCFSPSSSAPSSSPSRLSPLSSSPPPPVLLFTSSSSSLPLSVTTYFFLISLSPLSLVRVCFNYL